MKVIKLLNKEFPKTKKELWTLAEFLEDIYRSKNFALFYKFLKREIYGTGTNITSVTRSNSFIVLSSDYSGTPDIKIPKDKFKQLLDQLSTLSLPETAKGVIFKFDDDWNCEIEIIQLNFFEKLLLKLRTVKRYFQKIEPKNVTITRYKCFFDEYENRYSFTPNSNSMSPVCGFIHDVFGKEQFPELKKLLEGEITTYVSGMVRQEKIGKNIIISNEYYGYPKITLPKDKFAKLIKQLGSIAHLKHAPAKDKPKKIILTFDNKWNCDIEIIK